MKYYTLLFVLLFAFSCQKSQKPSYAKQKSSADENHPGKKIMENKCYVCHNPSATEDGRIAPPMIAIKRHYISSETSKEEFIQEMQNWIQNPIEENAKMLGAVKRFGLMPKQYFSKEDIKKISEYMFDNEIEKPTWFEDHYNKESGKGKGHGMGTGKGMHKQQQSYNFKNLPYHERGLKYALTTKAVLGKNLMGKIQKEGTLAALKFCNIKAYPLTDSMAVVHNATIKRVSDKPRNPKNLASSEENMYINIFKEDVKSAKDSEPIVVASTNYVNVYYPIKTNSMCIQCHGDKSADIQPNVLTQIDKLYPKDMATGYSENQVRGIWSISFNK
ncbi:c-type heme family protein [Polaribacter sp. M15]